MQQTEPAPSATRPTKQPAQPLGVVEISGALLKIGTVEALTGDTESTIRRRIKAGIFPKPVKHGTRCTRWVSDDIRAYLEKRARGEVPQ